jgi:spore coat protein CotH
MTPVPTPDAGAPPASMPPVDSSAELYDENVVPRFDIELPQASLDALGAEPDTYVRGTLRYGNETVNDIGVRIKGEASLRKLDEKAAFKLKFDEFVNDQAFRGLRRMTFNNMVEDPSFLAERLAFYLYRAAKLPAPRCNSALVYVNGTLFGIYANLETEDKTFLRRWFASDDGNLYEEGQRDFVSGAENSFELETNETASDHSDLLNLIATIQNAKSGSLLADLDAVLDTQHFLRFSAAEAAVNQWDMYSYTVFYPNNFRIYHDPTSNKFVFLPWGMDMSMKPFRDSGKAFIAIYSVARGGDNSRNGITAGVLFQRCVADADCKARYTAAVRDVLGVYESARLDSVATRYYDQIQAHVRADPRKEYTEREFEAGYQSVLSTIRGRAAAIRADIGN